MEDALPTSVVGFVIACIFALVHLEGRRLRFLEGVPRSRWLSIAGGVSVAYVFVHLLPELAAHQIALEDAVRGTLFERVEAHVYLIALLGLSVFYCLEQLMRARDIDKEKAEGSGPFWLHLAAFAVYNLIIGYLLVQSEERGMENLLFYGAAMTLHLLVVDQGLRTRHGQLYHDRGRYILAIAPIAGAIIASVSELDAVAIKALVAFIGGSVILNVLKEELPEDRRSDFKAFAAGVVGYAALLMSAG